MLLQPGLRFIVHVLLLLEIFVWTAMPVAAQAPTPAPGSAPSPAPSGTGAPLPTIQTPTTAPPAVATPLIDPVLAAKAPPAPPGFTLIDAGRGAWLFRKPYANGSPDFVQVISLKDGARVELLHGDLTEARPDKGSYGGPDPRMKSPAIETYWRNAANQDPNAFCVINGGFFYMPEYPTRLAFPLKVDGQTVTEGWGIKTYEDQKLILELWDGKADIRSLSKESLYGSTAPNILGGLSEFANKRIKYSVGRTFLGVSDRDANGEYETLLFLSTRTALQSGAAAVLREFGAGKVMMLDGGGSTQLLCRSGHHVRSDRPIPQALAIFSGKPPQIDAEIVRPPGWQALLEGERPSLEFEVRNTGAMAWTADSTQYVIDPSPNGMAQILPISETVAPGATTIITADMPSLKNTGLHTLEFSWRVFDGTENFDGPRQELRAVVLPSYMANRLAGLQQELAVWSEPPAPGSPAPQMHEVEASVKSWLAQNAPTASPTTEAAPVDLPIDQINPKDVILIPALMLPVILILGLLLARRNSG